MVAPHSIGEPVRSFVRVPGEGRAAKALCWDLSRCSSTVAAVAPLQLPAPPLAPVTQDPAAPSAPGPKRVPGAHGSSLQQLSREGAVDKVSEGKRLREEEQQERWEEVGHKPKVARTKADTERGQQPISEPSQYQSGSEQEVKRLRLQCMELQQQNEDLQQRLGQIYSLLKDKQRRSRLMRHLDTLVK